jgi:hypothetical protein
VHPPRQSQQQLHAARLDQQLSKLAVRQQRAHHLQRLVHEPPQPLRRRAPTSAAAARAAARGGGGSDVAQQRADGVDAAKLEEGAEGLDVLASAHQAAQRRQQPLLPHVRDLR